MNVCVCVSVRRPTTHKRMSSNNSQKKERKVKRNYTSKTHWRNWINSSEIWISRSVAVRRVSTTFSILSYGNFTVLFDATKSTEANGDTTHASHFDMVTTWGEERKSVFWREERTSSTHIRRNWKSYRATTSTIARNGSACFVVARHRLVPSTFWRESESVNTCVEPAPKYFPFKN